MAGFSILLPPTGQQRDGGNSLAPKMFDRRSSNTFNYFVGLNPERRIVIEAANALELPADQLAPLLGVDKNDVQRAFDCNNEVMTSPLMSALDRYSPGVIYAAMDFENLPTGAQRRLLEHGIILSSYFGLLRPDDLIPEYYFTHDAELPDVGSVKAFWTPYVTEALNELTAGHFVWNLLPDNLQSLWVHDDQQRCIVDVQFYQKKRGRLRRQTTGLDTLLGGLVNMLVKGPAESLESLEELEHPQGYAVDLNRSSIDDDKRRGTVVLVKS